MAPQAEITARRLQKGAAPVYAKVRIGHIPRHADPGAPHPFKKLMIAETSTNTAENKVWHYQQDSWKVNDVRIADESEDSAVVWEQLAAEEKKRGGKGIALDDWVVMPPGHTIPHECVIQYLRRSSSGPPLYKPEYLQPKPLCVSPIYESGRFDSRVALDDFVAATTLRDNLIIPVTVVLKDRFSWHEEKGYLFEKGSVNSYFTLNLLASDRYEDALKVFKDIRKEQRRIPQRCIPEFEQYIKSEDYNAALVSKDKVYKKNKKNGKTKQNQIMVNTSLWDYLRAFEYVKGDVWVMPQLSGCIQMWNWNESRRLTVRDFISSASITSRTPSLYIEIHFLPGARRPGPNYLLSTAFDGNETSSDWEFPDFDDYDNQPEIEDDEDDEDDATINVNRQASQPRQNVPGSSLNQRSTPVHSDNETSEEDAPPAPPKSNKRQPSAKRKGNANTANKPHQKGFPRVIKPSGKSKSAAASSKKRKHNNDANDGGSEDEAPARRVPRKSLRSLQY